MARTADEENKFLYGNTTKWSYRLYTTAEFIYATIPFHQLNKLPERYNEALLKKLIRQCKK